SPAAGSGSAADAGGSQVQCLVRCVGLRQPRHTAPMPWGRACACLPTRVPSTSRPPKPLGKGGDLLPRSFRHQAALRQRVSQRETSEHEQDARLRITPQAHVGHDRRRRLHRGLIPCDDDVVRGGGSSCERHPIADGGRQPWARLKPPATGPPEAHLHHDRETRRRHMPLAPPPPPAVPPLPPPPPPPP